MPGNMCHFLLADFDGPSAMLDALAYVKAARASGVSAGLEISQSGRGADVCIFFAGPVQAAVARAVGTVLLHEAIVLRGSMDLRSYDRLFPNQDVLPDSRSGFENLIAAPLQGRRRNDHGLTASPARYQRTPPHYLPHRASDPDCHSTTRHDGRSPVVEAFGLDALAAATTRSPATDEPTRTGAAAGSSPTMRSRTKVCESHDDAAPVVV